MKPRAATWIFGLLGSIIAHFAILAVLLIAIQPDPITKQPMPTSELEVQAYQLDRTKAVEQAPRSQQAKADTPEGAALDAGAIPESKAKVTQAVGEPVRPDVAKPTTAAEIRQGATPLAQVETTPAALRQSEPTTAHIAPAAAVASRVTTAAPASEKLALSQQTGQQIESAQVSAKTLIGVKVPKPTPLAAVMRSQSARPAALPVATVTAAAVPLSAILSTAQPAVAIIQTAVPMGAALAQSQAPRDDVPAATPRPLDAPAQQVDAAQVRPATPDAQKLKAALAFSGAEGDVDPVSIAAFQSFMQPGDIAATGDQLRDGVTGLLAQVPCSRMQVMFDPETATLQVNGHIPDNDLRAPVLAALRTQMGANITVSDNILILPRPQCGALSGIAGVGLPQSTDQITNPLVIGEDAQARVFTFAKGDLLSLDMTAPDYAAYIYLDYFDAAGNVLHLEPNEYAPLRQAEAQAVQKIGARTMEESGIKLVIGPPYGQEIAVAFATSEQLYDGLRPIQEPAAPYLEWLKEQVAKARELNPDFKGEWVYFFVSTAER
ncbi:MAG: hypothetical protein COC12_03790 [Rhodobacteraceae bacterium]|nr:MAG: hypothetical protein COC12_03790 [Paracoccaceae bacterium]